MDKRIKLFLENFIFFGGLSMLKKALPFITLPIITRMLPDAYDYGIVDMSNLIIRFGSAIAMLGVYDALFREVFEDKENISYKKKVISTGMGIVLMSCFLVCLVTFLLREKLGFYLFENLKFSKLILIVIIGIFLSPINTILAAPTRIRNERKVFFVTGLGFPIIGFITTFCFLKIGYKFEALIYGIIIMNVISILTFYFLNKKDFDLKMFDKKIAKELLKIGIPLMPTFLIYWIFNSIDRIMIGKILGMNELGIYSIGSRVASISQLIYTAFSGGWSYFSFSTMKEKDQVQVNSNIFEYLGVISFLAFLCSQPFIKPVFNIFFEGDYVKGNIVFSYLFLAPLMLMLFQVLANQVIIIKKSYFSTISLFLGAILNFILNFILIKNYGIRGASFSTLMSYIISVLMISLICLKYRLLKLRFRFLLISGILFVGILFNFFRKDIIFIYTSVYVLTFILIFKFYIKDIKNLKKR